MLKRLLITTVAASAITLAGASAVFATPTPSPAGQPNQSCETPGFSAPNGFSTDGFLHAKTVYAGAGQSAHANNPKAVSQYDVACFQLSTP